MSGILLCPLYFRAMIRPEADDCFLCSGEGESEGEGAGCIKSPDDGTCGCENSDGTFIYGGDSCS
jgi:hypothetical protein